MTDEKLPVLSEASVERELRSQILQKPYATFPLALGVLGLAGGALFGAPLAIAGGGLATLFGVGAWVTDFTFRYDSQASRLWARRRAAHQRHVDQAPIRIRKGLEERKIDRAVRQLDELESSFADLQTTLASRFSGRGLSMERFLGHSLQLREQTLEKFSYMLDLYDAVKSIPVSELRRSLRRTTLSDPERESIEERLGHHSDAQDEIKQLQDDIERGLTKLSEITIAVARIGVTDDEFETRLAEIKRLAGGAEHFQPEI